MGLPTDWQSVFGGRNSAGFGTVPPDPPQDRTVLALSRTLRAGAEAPVPRRGILDSACARRRLFSAGRDGGMSAQSN